MPLYDFGPKAHTYDDFYKTEYGQIVDDLEKRLVSSLLERVPRGKALEIGCGTGHWTVFFQNKGFDVIGIDISEQMIAVAREKYPQLNCQVADAENLAQFPDASFDAVFAITVLEFVDNPEKVIKQVKRILKPKGYFLAGVLNKNSQLGREKDSDETFRNARFFSAQELHQLLLNIGMDVKIDGCLVPEDGKFLDAEQQVDYDMRLDMGLFLAGLVLKS